MVKVIKVTKNIQCNHIKEPYEILYSIEYYTFEDYFSVMIYEQIEKDIDKFLKNSINIMLDKVNQIIDDYEYDFESKDETKSESIKNKLNEDIKYINNNTLTKIINKVNKGRKEFLQGWFSLVYYKFIKKYNVDLLTVEEIEEIKKYLTKLENNEIESISYYYIQNNFIEGSV